LTAGLVASGFQYLSDDAAIIEPLGLRLLPFTKSILVKQGSRPVLAPLYPRLMTDAPRRRVGDEFVWYLPPPEGAWPAGPVPIRHVVLSRYVRGADTVLTPISRSAGLQRLIEQSMSLGRHGPRGVSAAVEMLRAADCHALTVGDLPTAIDLLTRLVAGADV
jgi:hypothetical protein